MYHSGELVEGGKGDRGSSFGSSDCEQGILVIKLH
jgi:hypothetical protein